MPDFVHLHVHSEYSLLDGLCQIDPLVSQAKNQGQTALALTDHGAMYGVIHFYNACLEQGIKPIIGVETYLAENSRFDKQLRPGTDQAHLLLLAKNDQGYHNLLQLVSKSYLEGFSYKPRIDFELLQSHAEGLIATTGCTSGIVPKKLLQKDEPGAVTWLKKFHALFGDRFYLEIQSHPALPDVATLRDQLAALSRRYGIPLLATNDVHYIRQSDADAQDALLAVQTRKTITAANRLSMADSPDYYLKSAREMADALGNYPQAIENTMAVAEACNLKLPIGHMIFPEYPLAKNLSPEAALKQLAQERLKTRFPNPQPAILDRLNYELDIICQKGYASYFLIVQDFVNWAKQQGIRVGPGRGSAAGSLVSYALRITSIDPLFHNLPFERFMNPQRPSPPDIDIDIADERRDEVIRYVADKYGEDHVAQIITFGTMEARGAIRDIGRVLGLPYAEPDKIAKLIPPGYSIAEAVTSILDLQEYYKDPRYKRLLDLAKKVEGNARHASTHAAGVVIADKPLTEYTPIQRESRGGKIVTQYDMYALDLNVNEKAIGLLKMDFLGLRNLSILGKAIDNIRAAHDTAVDLSTIPLDDAKVFKALSQGETTGIFQLESPGMRRVAQKLKPSRFSDITAMVALYRPGPMELIDDFIAGKNDATRIKYPHPDLKPVLEETYGIPVYQEQVLQIANVFAGYSLGEADILRRAIGKKKKSILDKEKKRFVEGAQSKGYTAKMAETIWGFIDKFAGYGFNKAHSASYAMIAYQTAYLKVNYPIEYMTALLTIESMSHSATKDEKVSQAIEECRRLNLKVLPPDINRSDQGFKIDIQKTGPAIRFGLGAIKNVGAAAIDNILSVRGDTGPFTSVTDFLSRVEHRKVNKKVLESLIKVGSFDSFAPRQVILLDLDALREKVSLSLKQSSPGQSGLFAAGDQQLQLQDTFTTQAEFDPRTLHQQELALLGVSLNDSASSHLYPQASHLGVVKLSDLGPHYQSQSVTVCGRLKSLRRIVTKTKSQEMAFATLSDNGHSLDLVLFPKIYTQHHAFLESDMALLVSGKIDLRDDKLSLIVSKLEPFDSTSKTTAVTLLIPRHTNKAVLAQVGGLLKSHPGDQAVEIHIENGGPPKILKLPYTVALTPDLLLQIKQLLQT